MCVHKPAHLCMSRKKNENFVLGGDKTFCLSDFLKFRTDFLKFLLRSLHCFTKSAKKSRPSFLSPPTFFSGARGATISGGVASPTKPHFSLLHVYACVLMFMCVQYCVLLGSVVFGVRGLRVSGAFTSV